MAIFQSDTRAVLKRLADKGVGVHVGEWGCFNKTPHEAALAWMKDYLELWKEAGWGWALWNLRGSFGIVDSNRPGTVYEDFEGHKLDREMLELALIENLQREHLNPIEIAISYRRLLEEAVFIPLVALHTRTTVAGREHLEGQPHV